ncbi:MAG: nucleoside diphosphate kinase regulator [Anaerolineales bacterium]|nr:nucleoside diphosphate kinase regulator [Anaerolineales bacterium]
MADAEKPIYITEFDLNRLNNLIQDAHATDYHKSDYLKKLEAELKRAKIVSSSDIPNNVVTMNSTVRLEDEETNEEETYTLVFPENADLSQGKVSILAPIGTAMLGYQVGDIFEWAVPMGTRKLKIVEIIYQPEAAGDSDL